jgi:hypothetical protein
MTIIAIDSLGVRRYPRATPVAPLAPLAISTSVVPWSGATVSIPENRLVMCKLLTAQPNGQFGHADHRLATDHGERKDRSRGMSGRRGSRRVLYFLMDSKVRVAIHLCSQALGRSQSNCQFGQRGPRRTIGVRRSGSARAPP